MLRMFRNLGATLLLIFVLGCGAATAGQFSTGQAAVSVVGQFDFSSTLPGAEAYQLGTVSGVTLVGDRLIVSDGGFPFAAPINNRVLIFNDFSRLRPGMSADVVVGQADFGARCGQDKNQECTAAGAGAGSLSRPIGVASDGQKLAVADSGNNRVLIFNRIPASNGAAADVVLGQADFNGSLPSTSQTGMRSPNGVFFAGGRLFVADTVNHRVLIFNTVPTSNNARADVLLGQADFNARVEAAPSAGSMLDPVAVTTDGVRLIVTDLGFNRVLIFNRIPTSNGAAADVVVGQADFTGSAAGRGQASLNFPRYAYSDGTRLYIADAGNNRVLVYNEIPTQNGAPADVVLGQTDFSIVSESTAAEKLALPLALAPTPFGLLVADANNRRVVEFKSGLPLVLPGAIVNAASFGGNGLTRPSNVTAEIGAGGKIPAGKYYIKVTAFSAFPRESAPSEEIVVDVPTEESKITLRWDPVERATSYSVYVGTRPGLENRFFSTELGLATAPPVVFAGTPSPGDTASITITKSDGNTFNFTYTVREGDGLGGVANAMSAGINNHESNDAYGVTATSDGISSVSLKAKEVGARGGNLKYLAAATGTLTVSPTTATQFTAPTGGPPEPTLTFDSLIAAPSEQITLAYGTPPNQVVPGAIVAMFGTDLAPATVAAPAVPLPTELAGTSVLVNGEPAPLFFVSPNQINFQVPMEVGGTSISVQARKRAGDQEVLSLGVPVTLTIPEPALFSLDGTGAGTVLAFHGDGRPINGDSPASLDEQIVIYGTGFGLLADTPDNVKVTVSDTGGEVTQGTFFLRVTTVYPDGAESLGTGEDQVSSVTGNKAKISLTWDAVEGASGYRVYLGTRQRGYDRYYETSTNSFDLVSLIGKPGRPPIQTNVAGNGEIRVATTIVAILQGHDMPISYKGLAPNLVGLFQLNVKVPEDLGFSEVIALPEGQDVGRGELRLVVGSIESNTLFLPVRIPAVLGRISVTPEGLVTWRTRGATVARVFVRVDDGADGLFAEDLSGSAQADFVVRGHVYVWTLRDVSEGEPGAVLATFTLDLRVSGSLNVTREGLVSWSTRNVQVAKVFVKVDGGEDSLFAEGVSGLVQADFVLPGNIYVWTLRDFTDGEPGRVLATFTLDLR